MIDKIAVARWAVVGGVVTALGAAGAAAKLKRPTTGDACLCTPDAQAPNDLTAALEPSASPSFASRSATTPAGSTTAAGPLAAVLPGSVTADRPSWAASSGGVSNGAGFGAGGRYSGARAASTPNRSATLGGLWRLMSLSRRAPAHATSTARAAAPQAARTQRPRSGSGGASGSPSGPSTTLAPGVTQAGNLFSEQTATIPELLGGGSTPVISTVGGSIRGAVGKTGSLAATPEPGPLFLVGAGLIAIASLLRRRLAA